MLRLEGEDAQFLRTGYDIIDEMSTKRIIFGAGIEVIMPKERLRSGTKLYMAGPLGFSESTRPFHEKVIQIVQRMEGGALDPWTLAPIEKIKTIQELSLNEKAIAAWEQLNHEIGENNLMALKEATGVVANLDGQDVDSGTAAEIGAAFVLGIPILGYRGDFRMARDNWGGNVNLQVEYFIKQSAGGKGEIITAISQLPQALLRIWGR
mgnify:CR=1 FL=1